jgi:diguanylate cyclase (GGDEF)-like protein
MELINPRTFLFVANLLGLLCAMVLWVQARSFPKDIEGLHDWARAVVLMSFASGLVSLRGFIPDAASIVLANGLFMFGELLLVFGLLRYTGRKPQWRPALDAIVGVLLLLIWLTYGSHSYQGRIFLVTLTNIVFFSLGAWLAWQAKPAGFGQRFLTSALVLGAGIAAWRLVTLSMNVNEADDVFDRSLIQQVYLGVFSLGILGLSIGFILIANERLREELEFLATRDPMTGALNRRAFFARADVEWARSARSQRPLSVIAADIDFFKKVNDSFGHHVGDLVIKDYALRAGHMLRLPDILARFGGEEFVILLPETGLKEACQVAERIRREVEKRQDKALPPYTVSLGVAVANAGHGDFSDLQALLAHADAALYKAKQGGRNRVAH